MRHTETITAWAVVIRKGSADPRLALGKQSGPFLSYERNRAVEFAIALRPHLPGSRTRAVRVIASFTFENKPTRKNRK